MIVGLHLDNLDEPAESSYAKIRALRAGIVGLLWTEGTRHRHGVIERLLGDRPDLVLAIRVGPSRRCDAAEWLTQARAALAEVPPSAVAAGRVWLRALNEVNLPEEGDWPPEEYAAFLGAVRAGWEWPGVPLLTAPLSLGRPGWEAWWRRFLAACGGVPPADRIAVNCYAHLVGAIGPFFAPGLPVDVTEVNALDPPPGPARAAWLGATLADLAARGAASAQIFIAGGRSHGAWDERYIVTEEEAALLGSGEAR